VPANFAVRELYVFSRSLYWFFTTARAYAVVYKRHFTATNFAAGFCRLFSTSIIVATATLYILQQATFWQKMLNLHARRLKIQFETPLKLCGK